MKKTMVFFAEAGRSTNIAEDVVGGPTGRSDARGKLVTYSIH